MRTLTTVEHVERKDSGATVVTFLGGNKAGTFDEAIGDLAEKAHAENLSVGLQVDKRQDGKLFIESIELIYPPEELGGPANEIASPTGDLGAGAVSGEVLVAPLLPQEAATEQGDDTSPEAVVAAAEITGQTIRDADGFIAALAPLTETTPTPMQLAAKVNEIIEFLNQEAS